MTDQTQSWLEARRHALGASETPIILGQTTWGSAREIAARKLGLLPPGEESSYLDWRKKLEGPMAEHFLAHREGWDCTRDPSLMLEVLDGESAKCDMHAFKEEGELWCHSQIYPWLGASPDALCWNGQSPSILEFKTEYDKSKWDAGIPTYYCTQVMQQMLVTGLHHAVIVVSFGGGSETPEMYELDFHADYAQEIALDASKWWDKYIIGGEEVPITGSEADRKIIGKLADLEAGREMEGSQEVIHISKRIHTIAERMAEQKHDIDKLKNHIRDTMAKSGAEVLTLPGGDSWRFKANKKGVYALTYKEAK